MIKVIIVQAVMITVISVFGLILVVIVCFVPLFIAIIVLVLIVTVIVLVIMIITALMPVTMVIADLFLVIIVIIVPVEVILTVNPNHSNRIICEWIISIITSRKRENGRLMKYFENSSHSYFFKFFKSHVENNRLIILINTLKT